MVRRKPLILCRATILGLLLPASDNPEADRACFLALLTLDDDGLLRRFKGFQAKELLEFAAPDEAAEYEAKRASGILPEDPHYSSGETPKARFQAFRTALERHIFLRLPYDQ
jgi:putative DNA methylase